MARRVFFSFHYERDIWRANVVRNSWVTQERKAAGFWDASLWEEAKRKGEAAIRKMINEGLENTPVTAVLVGKETSTRKYVQYEIDQSIEKGKGLLAVKISSIDDQNGNSDTQGANPLPATYDAYLWFSDEGYENFGQWVEKAARAAGK